MFPFYSTEHSLKKPAFYQKKKKGVKNSMFKGIIQPCSLFTKKNLSSFTNTWNTNKTLKNL